MENHFDKRLDPTLLVEDAKSVISLLLNYYPVEQQIQNSIKYLNMPMVLIIIT
jgi:epoxyqueuosine reductase